MMVPTPLEAKLRAPGRAFAIAMKSLTVLTGSDEGTTTICGELATMATAAKLATGSYGTLLMCGLIEIGLVDENSSV
jgi:hypothetical protein